MNDNELFELWRPVKNYIGYYDVSSQGRIRSLGGRRGSSERVLKPANMKGYLCVSLSASGTKRTRLVHHLVAEAFIDNPNGLTEVNHIDGDKKNNHRHNLEWTSHADNIAHAVDTGLTDNKGEKHGMHKLTENNVEHIRRSILSGAVLAKHYGISEQTISDIRLGKSWKHLLDDAGELTTKKGIES